MDLHRSQGAAPDWAATWAGARSLKSRSVTDDHISSSPGSQGPAADAGRQQNW